MVATAIISAVTEHRLRHVDGRTYSVVEGTVPVDAQRSTFYLGADCLEEEADAVRDAMATELFRLRTAGPRPEELVNAVASIRRALRDERSALGAAYTAADDHLLGRPARSLPQVAAEVDVMSVAEVAQVVDHALGKVLWTVPFSSSVNDRRLVALPVWSSDRVPGTEFQPGEGRDPDRSDDRLVVGPDGVSAIYDGNPVTVRWSDIRAACRYRDRCWVLHGADGFTITVRARDWFRGADAVGDIDLMAPRSLVVEIGEDLSPGEPDLDPAAPLAPAPASSAAAWRSPPTGSAGHLSGPSLPPPPPPPAAAFGRTPTLEGGGKKLDSSTWGAMAIVWTFAAAISLWFLSTLGDGGGNRARLRLALLVVAGAAYATRVLLRR